MNDSVYLRCMRLPPAPELEGYPYSLPVWRQGQELMFTTPVTLFAGENGCGKSSLLEALAVSCALPAIGGADTVHDATLRAVRPLSAAMKLTWTYRSRRGFFLRAEDFFGYIRRVDAMQTQMRDELDRVEQEYQNRSAYAKAQARAPFAGSLSELDRRYGQDPDAVSHGEGYLRLFEQRFVPEGIYLLDEPECPLSPLRQLALIQLLCQSVARKAQFIIATHSPILMACPGARVLWIQENGKIEETAYQDLEHVQITKSFLNDPERFLRYMREDEA